MNSTQLNLFSKPIATSTQYKAGDWVKLKRKPKRNGINLKRGDTIKIVAVHPTDGSIKFWNDFYNCWDYLYPEDFKLTINPSTAVPIVESVVGEIAAAVPIVESVVGEIAAAPIVESVVGERKNYWNSKGYSGNGWLESHYKIRRDGKQHSINCPEIGCTGPYNSYRWMDGKRQRAKYCPASKCPAVRKALKNGEPIDEILKIISSQ